MTKQLKRSIKKIIQEIDDVKITPEAEELILEAVKEYTMKIGVESKKFAYIMNRKTLREDDVDFAVRHIKRKMYPHLIISQKK